MNRKLPLRHPTSTAEPQPIPPLVDCRILTVPEDHAGARLDRALALLLSDLSRSRLKALIEAGAVRRASGQTIVEPSRKVKAGEVYEIRIPAAAPAIPEAQAIPRAILYEDDDVVVLDKPAGLVVHPAPGNPDRTLVNALLAHCGESLSGIGGVRRPGIVHRLDKDTSGVMVAAKNDAAHAGLARQFAVHDIERVYLAVAAGGLLPRQGTIEGNIARHPQDRKRMAVVSRGGRTASTHYKVIEAYGPAVEPLASLVECELLTGRTHQVRVHLAHCGHPLIGDPLYFRARSSSKRQLLARLAGDFGRQALHARALGFEHPRTGRPLRFEAEIPSDIKSLIKRLRELGATSNNREV